MRILDRYEAKQLLPVWLWCLIVFTTVSLFIDLFEHLDEILRYSIPLQVVADYYLNFMPLIFVQACPLALLLSTAFVATRLVRHQELLAMNAGGLSRLRASLAFLFVGWLAAVGIFLVNDLIVPRSSAIYQRLRQDAFRDQANTKLLQNVATMDGANRIYHAQFVDPARQELGDLTILEHDSMNRPRRSLYARRAQFAPGGLRMFDGTITRMTEQGLVVGSPEPFSERLFSLPATLESFQNPDTQLESMRIGDLRRQIMRLKGMGITNLRRHRIELASRLTLPLMNVVVCFIGFVGATKPTSRGKLQALGWSLSLGICYYLVVAASQGMGKEGLLPVLIAVSAPHLIALALCWRALWQRD